MTTNHTNNKIKTFSQWSWVQISALIGHTLGMGTIVTALYLTGTSASETDVGYLELRRSCADRTNHKTSTLFHC